MMDEVYDEVDDLVAMLAAGYGMTVEKWEKRFGKAFTAMWNSGLYESM
jgi:hypothetical protein